MADDSNSSMVAIVAIVIIVLLALGGYYFFMNKQAVSPAGATVNVEAPSAPAGAPTKQR